MKGEERISFRGNSLTKDQSIEREQSLAKDKTNDECNNDNNNKNNQEIGDTPTEGNEKKETEENKCLAFFKDPYLHIIRFLQTIWDWLVENQYWIYFIILTLFLAYWLFNFNIIYASLYILTLLWYSFELFPYMTLLTYSSLYFAFILLNRLDKIKSVMHPVVMLVIVFLILFYYVMFCHPLQSFYYKKYFSEALQKPGLCVDYSQEIKLFEEILQREVYDDVYRKVFIFDGYKEGGKSKLLKHISNNHDNVVVYKIPVGASNYTTKLAKNLGMFQIPNLLLSLFKTSTSSDQTFLFDYLNQFTFKISKKKPVIIIDEFDILMKNNPKDASVLLDTARSLLGSYTFVFIGGENLGYRTKNIYKERVSILRFPKPSVLNQVTYVECLMSYRCPTVKVTRELLQQIVTPSYFLNERIVLHICNNKTNLYNKNEFVTLFMGSPLYNYMGMQFKSVGLNLELEPENLIKKNKTSLIKDVIKIIDKGEIIYDEQNFTLDILNNPKVFVIKVKNFKYYVSLRTQLHKIFAEMYFGNENSEKRKRINGLINK